MKKLVVMSVGAMLLLSSCGTYTGAGASTGGWFGSVVGSAIGGIAGGPRGSDIGTLVGMVGGAVVGAAVGSAADNAEQQKYEDYARQRSQQRSAAVQRRTDSQQYQYDSGFDATNSGDDRLFGFGEDFSNSYSGVKEPVNLEIRNARVLDANHDGVLQRGEQARMVFEIYNHSPKTVYGVQPSVVEVTGNKHVHISDNILVESIAPGKGIRYSALIGADNRLKDGEVVIRIGVLHGNKAVARQAQDFRIRTSRR